jgi:hypothetical protein
VQLRSLKGDLLGRQRMDLPFETLDRLQVWVLTLHHLPIPIARPGRYKVALLADDQKRMVSPERSRRPAAGRLPHAPPEQPAAQERPPVAQEHAWAQHLAQDVRSTPTARHEASPGSGTTGKGSGCRRGKAANSSGRDW